MTFIKTIPKEEAQSPLKELYPEIEDTIGMKKITNGLMAASIDYDIAINGIVSDSNVLIIF